MVGLQNGKYAIFDGLTGKFNSISTMVDEGTNYRKPKKMEPSNVIYIYITFIFSCSLLIVIYIYIYVIDKWLNGHALVRDDTADMTYNPQPT